VHPGWALTLSLAVAPQSGSSSQAPSDLLSELTAKVAAIVGTTVPPPTISITCSSNLRERVCTAEIRTGAAREVVMVTRPHEQAAPDPTTAIPLVVHLRPIIAQAQPILDAAIVGRRLLVLDSDAVTMYERAADAWRRLSSHPLPTAEPWPRDLRGKLLVSSGTWEAFLPGMSCQGTLEPLRGTCTRDRRPWPLGIENTGMASGRNVFTMPDGRRYFSAATLESETGARVMLATDEGKLVLLDGKQNPVEAEAGVAGDVAAISSPCVQGGHVVVTGGHTTGGMDPIRVVRVLGRELTDVAPPLALTGRVTALWTASVGQGALVVARNPTTRGYEAFQIDLACGR
jgi:hypothetical protein